MILYFSFKGIYPRCQHGRRHVKGLISARRISNEQSKGKGAQTSFRDPARLREIFPTARRGLTRSVKHANTRREATQTTATARPTVVHYTQGKDSPVSTTHYKREPASPQDFYSLIGELVQWSINLRKNVKDDEIEEYAELLKTIESCQVATGKVDKVLCFCNDVNYSVELCYNMKEHCGTNFQKFDAVWKVKTPEGAGLYVAYVQV